MSGSWQLMLWQVVEPIARRVKRLVAPPLPPPPPPPTVARDAKRRRARAARVPEAPRARAGRDDPDRPFSNPHTEEELASLRASLRGLGMAARYERVVEAMVSRYGIRVRKWRSGSSGIAWYVEYRDGRVSRLIESPKPKGPMSLAIFLHEVGHHAIGFRVHRPRCLEEYHAWGFAFETLEALGFEITERVAKRRRESLKYAVRKARRRGIQRLPMELAEFAA